MCYWLITYRHFACGHDRQTAENYLDCHMSICTISTFHKQEEHDCVNTCAQQMIADQHIVLYTTDVDCNQCRGIPDHIPAGGRRRMMN
ncbi:hypothetical protein FOMPIDRAFT_44706 [Fomitopsis schrenkii]|uniref:Uncharacterized protein n=1 Tax=Fomitopsis schrenkii TaxID=2126942 RepID=S8FSR2_FOMSC|nr:hypothetical protein FOMPIDRAFT_44706 [Fomitopsis schrenkii]